MKLFLLGVLMILSSSCSSDSGKPDLDFRLPIVENSIDDLQDKLRAFGRVNDLYILENDRDQMKILNGGKPALSFWFSMTKDSKTAMNVLTVNEGNFMRVMMFSKGFNDREHMQKIHDNFLNSFDFD